MKSISGSNINDTGTAFLVGAGRSGTTLLYKLLCLHDRIAFISNYDVQAPWVPIEWFDYFVRDKTTKRLRSWFNQGGNAYYVKRSWLKKIYPTPVEGESIYEACGVPLYPSNDMLVKNETKQCLCKRFESIRRKSNAKILLSKRTANNRRIPYLNQILPEARYVHLVRDGREVAFSLSQVEWWNHHYLWWAGATPIEMMKEGHQNLSLCAENWVREVDALQNSLESIAKERVMEVRYEELLQEPLEQLEKILKFLDIRSNERYREAIEDLSIVRKEAKWKGKWTVQQKNQVMNKEEQLLEEYGYV